MVESKDLSITDMNERYRRLLHCLEKWSNDATPVVDCEAVLYSDFPLTKDSVTQALSTPSDVDSTLQEILEVILNSLTVLVKHLVEDHLPGGALDSPNERVLEETKSVSKSNVISERDFANLDRLLREKPNATTLSLEGLILFSTNKTAAWLMSKSQEEKEELFKKARSLASDFRALYKQRRVKLLEDRAKVLQDKQLALQRL